MDYKCGYAAFVLINGKTTLVASGELFEAVDKMLAKWLEENHVEFCKNGGSAAWVQNVYNIVTAD